MKFLLIAMCILSALSAFSQSRDKPYVANSEYFFDSLTVKENISSTTIKSFNRKFTGIMNPVWHATATENTVKFQRDNIRYHVFYSKKGKWKATIKYLSAGQLPNWIVSRLASDFKEYSVFFSQHIATPAGNIYLVKIEKGNDWKCVRINREGVEVMGEYVRN